MAKMGGESRLRLRYMSFPKLNKNNSSVTSPKTPEYNCIAWAVNITDQWWWPDINHQYYWPPKVQRKETQEAFIHAYETLGFVLCLNDEYEDNFDKIAIYADPSGKPTHAARQLKSGHWTSKLGQNVDIQHDTLDALEGPTYGTIAITMKRPT